MAFIINRLKTIVGSDASFFKGLSRILFYVWVSNPIKKIWVKVTQQKVPRNQYNSPPHFLSEYNQFTETGVLTEIVIGNPRVSIIIPTKNKANLVKQCIDSIIKQTTYSNYEIILVNNRSDEDSFFDLVKGYSQKRSPVKLVNADIDFNFSKLINIGRAEASGTYLLLLNNDTEVIASDWLEMLIGIAQQPKTGAVGCKLLYPNKTIQHAGVMIESDGIPKHVCVGCSETEPSVNIIKQYAAVTAAALMIAVQKFDEVNGFDERFAVEYNDMDFCLKLIQLGYYNIYQPKAVLFHHESASRRHPFSDKKNYNRYKQETQLFKSKWH